MNITRLLAFLTLFSGLTLLSAVAQVQPIDYVEKQQAEAKAAAKDGPAAADKVLRISAAAEPIPALQIRFWPDRFEMVNGNTFVPFQRAMILMLERNRTPREQDPWFKNYDQWMERPLDELPTQEVAKYLDRQQAVMKELHRAMRMRDSQYELGIDDLRGLETVQLLLPEFQNMRQLARLLVLETRLALAEGRTDDAIRSIRVGFRLGEATGNAADLLISRLVGVAISSLMLNQVEQLMQMEDSPNMYWALATLPDSIWRMEEAIQFEASVAARVFPELSRLPDDDVEPAVWRGRLTRAIADMQSLDDLGIDTGNAGARMLAGAMVVALTEPSRAHLIAGGMDAERVQAMSPSEAVVRATAEELQRIQDNFSKWMLLPDSMRMQYTARSEATLKQVGRPGTGISSLAGMATNLLMPAITAANRAGIRPRQTIARLATIEAIRDHMASHGELPASLDQLTNLPAWPDPFTQQPFGYERESNNRAKLISAPAYPSDPNATIVLEFASP
ncbi:hypothetical protein [Roseimaritima ulvae]|uniref:Uncharacterized protein n=1 Tax=Roseimaritima ulvae TaxID=980254 RepID=A0A5B9QLK4_9BACT|nr:hypothetical protein [Roseimaritima ulvae]QEG38415.1 hypothetical protein UC8_03720 [Roseimaritima ulvae]